VSDPADFPFCYAYLARQKAAGVDASVSDATRKLPGFGLEDLSDDTTPNFYFIEAVWSAVMECDQITSEKVRTIQSKIRKAIGLTDAEYRTMKRPGPLCDPSAKGTPRSPNIPHN
jgi:hypothetical protein